LAEFAERWQNNEVDQGPQVLRQLHLEGQAKANPVALGREQIVGGDQEFSTLAAFKMSFAVAKAIPEAVLSELGHDISERPADLMARNAAGVVVGAVGTVLLKKPQVAAVVALPALSIQGIKAFSTGQEIFAEGGKFVDSSETEEKRFIQEKSQALGSKTAHYLETAPGLYLGGRLACQAFGAPPLYTWIKEKVQDRVVYPVKDRLAFYGSGVEKLPPSFVKDSGHLDAFALSKELAARHSYAGVEVGRTYDLATGKLSRVIVGKADDIGYLPRSLEADKVPFHVHGPHAEVGARPSFSDLASTGNLGVIKQGEKLTFYEGRFGELKNLQLAGAGNRFAPSLHSLTLNTEARTATRVTGRYLSGRRLVNLEEEKVDYEDALRILSNLDMKRVGQELRQIAK
jgi:hypothetical protein